jgi:hypothetical protein
VEPVRPPSQFVLVLAGSPQGSISIVRIGKPSALASHSLVTSADSEGNGVDDSDTPAWQPLPSCAATVVASHNGWRPWVEVLAD